MKAFDEWFRRDIQPHIDARDTSVHKCDFEHSWRAALEWAKIEACDTCGCELIDQELEEN